MLTPWRNPKFCLGGTVCWLNYIESGLSVDYHIVSKPEVRLQLVVIWTSSAMLSSDFLGQLSIIFGAEHMDYFNG